MHLVIDRGTLSQLIKQIGAQNLLSLLQRSVFSAVYCEECLGTHTETKGAFQFHSFIAVTFAGNQSSGNLKKVHERFQFDLERLPLAKKVARRFTKSFLDRVPVRKLSGDHFLKGGIPEAAKRDILNKDFSLQAIRRTLALVPGGYDPGEALKFDVMDSELGLHVFHNIDLESINRRRLSLQPSNEPLTVAHLLSQVLETRADLSLASFYGGDFVTSTLTSSIIQLRHEDFFRRSFLNANSQRQFKEIVLPDTPSLAEVIDSGERTFDEFLLLLDKAQRFKQWLKSANPDEGLVRTYLHDITSEGWIQKLPSKSIRYMLTLALDAANPLAGLVVGLVDNFLLEKMLGGWRPNHFISRKLGPFISASQA